MTIGVYFASNSMSAQKYSDVLKRLETAGAGSPKGRLYHAAFGDPADLSVFDVWASQEEFDAFGAVLMPILAAVGATAGAPHIMPIHNIIKP